MGGGLYSVGAQARGGFTSFAELNATAARQAEAFGARQGKGFRTEATKNDGLRGFTPQEAELRFRCE